MRVPHTKTKKKFHINTSLLTIFTVQPINLLAVRAWFMHDEALAHFSRPVPDVLNNAFHDKWTGIAGLVSWLPHLLHINPLHFHL
jgi:hypothetical protein